MSDLRKPKYILLLRYPGNGSKPKRVKIELFESRLWRKNREVNKPFSDARKSFTEARFRLRVNGKWWPKNEMRFVTKTEAKELIFRNIKAY